jgi:rubrerythrin
MEPVTIEQALRNAIATERSAARFYDRLSGQTQDAATRSFLARLVDVELAHAKKVEELASQLGKQLPTRPVAFAAGVETAPCWAWVEDMDLGEALAAALESETKDPPAEPCLLVTFEPPPKV